MTLAAAVLLSAVSAHALGTAAGTVIQNRAMATFDVGAVSNLTAYSLTVSTTVDELVDVAVGNAGAGTTFVFSLPASSQPLLFTVTNNGNGTESFGLSFTESAADDFDTDPAAAFPAEIYIDNGDAIFTTADGSSAYGSSLTLSADETVGIWVVQDIPAGAGSVGDVAAITLSAVHMHAPASTVPGTAYAGQGDGGTNALLGANGGAGSVTKAYQLALTAFNMLKSSAVLNTLGGTEPVPGATVTYTIQFWVTGSGGVSNLVVTDPVPADTTFVPASITAGPIAADSAGLIGSTVTVSYASTTISAVAGTQTITFDVTID
jgi:uncharacterized repeat protein (TIGR01451 family)